MRTRDVIRIATPLALLVALVLPASPAALAGEREKKIGPRYKRTEAQRSPAARPGRPKPIDTALRIEAVTTSVRTRPDRADRRARERQAALDRLAADAGAWAAEERVRIDGAREYYRVGFYEGQRLALNDREIGGWDSIDGERLGRRDADARDQGSAEGRAAAEFGARHDAKQQVAGQFMDLSRAPGFLPDARTPIYTPELPAIPSPSLDQVFADFPLRRFGPLRERIALYFDGWSWNGPRLAGCGSYTEFYDGGFRDPSAAFDFWARHRGVHGGPATAAERLRFAESFNVAFDRRLVRLYARKLLPAHDLGFDDGFAYGAFVRQELEFRRGYRRGFGYAVGDSAIATFNRSYRRSYERAYRDSFADWSDNPRPAIGEVWLRDGDDDGVTEPGEELLVDFEVINYGGTEGRFPVEVDGSVLVAAARRAIRIPARSVVQGARPLLVEVSSDTPPRSNSRILFSLAGESRELPLAVSYPFEISRGSVRIDRDDLGGRLIVEVRVANRSNRPVSGIVEISTPQRPAYRGERRVTELAGRDDLTVAFDVGELDPLALMAGNVSLTFDAVGRGIRQDSLTYRIEETARDLSDRSLTIYLLRLAADETAQPGRIREARRLMLLRLREDWLVATVGRGNPYKSDYTRRGTETALGDLVQAYRDRAAALRQPDVFRDFSDEVAELAATMPGAHPFLRKYMRRLAAQLP